MTYFTLVYRQSFVRSIRRGKAGRLDIQECSKRNKLAPSVLLGLLGLHGLRSAGSCTQNTYHGPIPALLVTKVRGSVGVKNGAILAFTGEDKQRSIQSLYRTI